MALAPKLIGGLSLSGEGKVTPRANIGDFVNDEKISYHALTLLNQMATLSQTPSVYIYVCMTALLLHLESSEIRSALCVKSVFGGGNVSPSCNSFSAEI